MSERSTLHEWTRLEKEFLDFLKTVSESIGQISLTLILFMRGIGRIGLSAWPRSESKLKLIGRAAHTLDPLGRLREWLAVRANYPPHLVIRNGTLQCSVCGQWFRSDAKPSLSSFYAEHIYAVHGRDGKAARTQKTLTASGISRGAACVEPLESGRMI